MAASPRPSRRQSSVFHLFLFDLILHRPTGVHSDPAIEPAVRSGAFRGDRDRGAAWIVDPSRGDVNYWISLRLLLASLTRLGSCPTFRWDASRCILDEKIADRPHEALE